MNEDTKEGVATVDEGLKRYRQALDRAMKSRAGPELLEAIGPDGDKLDQWTILG